MRKYTKEHEWVDIEENIATVGVTNYAQDSLGDVVFVDLPKVDRNIKLGDAVAVLESVKIASDIYAPLDGKIIEVNSYLSDDSSLVNSDAEGKAWIFKMEITNQDQVSGLMDKKEYDDITSNG